MGGNILYKKNITFTIIIIHIIGNTFVPILLFYNILKAVN